MLEIKYSNRGEPYLFGEIEDDPYFGTRGWVSYHHKGSRFLVTIIHSRSIFDSKESPTLSIREHELNFTLEKTSPAQLINFIKLQVEAYNYLDKELANRVKSLFALDQSSMFAPLALITSLVKAQAEKEQNDAIQSK